jgi:prepilin-type processing-associated H-X9-DG protein
MIDTDFANGLPADADLFHPEPDPFAWIRESASFWLYEENGAFGIPRNGVEAEPKSWENRRYQSNFAFADGRVLIGGGEGPMHPPHDAEGRPAVLGAGPLRYHCLEAFRRWRVEFDGEVVDTTARDQIAKTVDPSRRTRLRYAIELSAAAPVFKQEVTPAAFTTWGKGVQRDALSVGLGLRFEQLMQGEGELFVDGERRSFKATGMRVKRRSVRTDALFLRGHCWQSAVFPDGRAFGYLAYPPHEDGFEAWNRGFIYQDGRMHLATAVKIPWLGRPTPEGDDVSLELQSDLGVTQIKGASALSTFMIGSPGVWGLNLNQGGARYEWDGQTAYGMLERSTRPT